MRLEKPYFSRPMHSMFVNINDFCYSLTVVAINIERGGSPHCQFNSFTVILVRLFVLWFCSFGLRVRCSHCMYRCEGEDLIAAFVSFRFILFRTGRFASYCIFVYSCGVSSLILALPYATALLGSMRSRFHLVRFVSISLSICRLVFSDREYDLILKLRRYGFIAPWAHFPTVF